MRFKYLYARLYSEGLRVPKKEGGFSDLLETIFLKKFTDIKIKLYQ